MVKPIISRLVRIVKGGDGGDGDLPLLEAGVSRVERFVHFWMLVWRSFVRNRCPVRASALSYTTLLAFIPMLAVAMSVTSMFLKNQGKEQIEHVIQGFVDNVLPAVDAIGTNAPDPAFTLMPASTNLAASLTETNAPAGDTSLVKAKRNVSRQAAEYIHSFIENTYSGTLGFTGVVFLVLTAILTLTRVEETFNDIWGITRGRDWWARITNYFTTIVLGPTLLVAALGLASGPHLQHTRSLVSAVPYLEPLVSTVLPVAVICLTLALFYKLVPNTRVEFGAALAGGTLAGVCWHVYNILGFLLASRAVNASKIYGGLALVPLMMGGLYVVWLTVLFGAQVAYAFQNRAAYLQDRLAENVNQRGREFVALRLMTCLGQRFQRGLPPATIAQISAELGVPSRLVQQVLRTLLAAHLVVEVTGAQTGYSPARPLESITAHHILLALRSVLGQELLTQDEPVRAEVYGEFARIQQAEEQAASAVTLQALVSRVQARLELAPPEEGKKE
jgi:membrane protein